MENPQLQKAIKEVQNGNLSSFGLVYDSFIAKIYNYLYYRARHKQTAEDLTSLTFSKAFEKIKSFDEAQGTIQAWLYRIARNTLIDHYRTSHPPLELDIAGEVRSPENIERNLIAKQELEEVKGYLNKLPDEHRELVVMRVWDELSYQEISEITGKTEAALKMSMSRVMSRLRTEVSLVLTCLLILD